MQVPVTTTDPRPEERLKPSAVNAAGVRSMMRPTYATQSFFVWVQKPGLSRMFGPQSASAGLMVLPVHGL